MILSGKLLTQSDLHSVTEDLWDIRNMYSKLGIALGLHPADIEAIQKSKNGEVDDCFSDVIKQCIDQGLYQGQIIKTLESVKFRKHVLATTLREKYKVYL